MAAASRQSAGKSRRRCGRRSVGRSAQRKGAVNLQQPEERDDFSVGRGGALALEPGVARLRIRRLVIVRVVRGPRRAQRPMLRRCAGPNVRVRPLQLQRTCSIQRHPCSLARSGRLACSLGGACLRTIGTAGCLRAFVGVSSPLNKLRPKGAWAEASGWMPRPLRARRGGLTADASHRRVWKATVTPDSAAWRRADPYLGWWAAQLGYHLVAAPFLPASPEAAIS